MGLGEEVKEKVEEVERKIIYDIVKELPLVPDQARSATDSRAYALGLSGLPSFAARASAARARLHVGLLRAKPAASVGAPSAQRGGHSIVAGCQLRCCLAGAPCGALGAQAALPSYGPSVGAAYAALQARREATQAVPVWVRVHSGGLAADASAAAGRILVGRARGPAVLRAGPRNGGERSAREAQEVRVQFT